MSGSGFKVPLTIIKEIRDHPNADRLEIACVYGFEVVVAKGTHCVGDEVFYVPIDSVIPQKLEDFLFPPESKIKLSKRRVRQTRIRKFPSQGMLLNKPCIEEVYNLRSPALEKDYAELLEITKYEPVRKKSEKNFGGSAKKTKKLENPMFSKYGGIPNIKWYPEKFKEGELVEVTEKIHGTNARASILPTAVNTLWKKVLNFLGVLPKWENCYGSNNVQLQDRKKHKGFYGSDIYGKTFQGLDIFNKIRLGESVYGEIIGEGIQKNYNYGLKGEDRKFLVFDVRVTVNNKTRWLDPSEVRVFCVSRGLETVPSLFSGPFKLSEMKKHTVGDSVFHPGQRVREGIVIKPQRGVDQGGGSRKSLKMISEKYLDKDQSEFS